MEAIGIRDKTNPDQDKAVLETIRAKYAHHSSSEAVYLTLKEAIVQLLLKPGEQISENEISTRLNISRTPVREAFIRLSLEQLLEIYPQRGTFVARIDLEQVEEARFVREHLESAVVRLAAETFNAEHLFELETNLMLFERMLAEKNHSKLFELDEQFHETIAKGCGKGRIWTIIKQMKAHLDRVRILSLVAEYHGNEILEQHHAIVSAIRSRQPEQAEEVMTKHLHLVLYDLDALQRDYPDYLKRE